MSQRRLDDYRSHTTCITEVERYEKRAPATKNGKIPPQHQWMDLITGSIDKAPPHLKDHVGVMSTLDNVPRKEKQFRNFAANSLNLRGKKGADQIVGEIWAFLQSEREKQKQEKLDSSVAVVEKTKQDHGSVASELAPDTRSEAVQKFSPPVLNESKTTQPKPSTAISSKSVKKVMKKELKKAKGGSLKLKALRKAVVASLGLGKNEKRVVKKLVVETATMKSFLLEGKVVKLRS